MLVTSVAGCTKGAQLKGQDNVLDFTSIGKYLFL